MVRFYCCCCSSHLGAAKVIGILWTVARILFIALLSTLLAVIENYDEFSRWLWEVYELGEDIKVWLQVAIGIYAAILLVDVGLIYGSYQKIRCLLTTWAIVTGIRSILELIFAIIVLQDAFIDVVGLIINIWAILTVTSAELEIKQENEQKRNAIVPFAVRNSNKCTI